MADLKRRLGLGHASAINMIDMVGIGPFITLPMVIGMMNGPYFLYAWIAGAFLFGANWAQHFREPAAAIIF
jgi:fructoselysine transporter